MSGKNLLIATVAVAAVGCGTAGIIMNSKKSRIKRIAKKTSNTLYTAGTILRALSCQAMES